MPHGIVPSRASTSRTATAGGSAQDGAVCEVGRNGWRRRPRVRVPEYAHVDWRQHGHVARRSGDDCEGNVVGVGPLRLVGLRTVGGFTDRDVATAGRRDPRRLIGRRAVAILVLLRTATRVPNLAVDPARVCSPRRTQTDQQRQRCYRGDENDPTESGGHDCTIHILRVRAFRECPRGCRLTRPTPA